VTTVDATTIRSLFSTSRPIDRPIEKVIDYYATDERRLLMEVEEYEVTDNVERNVRRFLDVFEAGVSTGQVTETSIWVSGFYGSGKSSFTKYLGFALDPQRLVEGRRFLDLLGERIGRPDVRQQLKTLAMRHPVAVIMLDLGAEQLAASSTTSVSMVLYWKVLQWAGYSREQKVAQLELRLERDGRLQEFCRAHEETFNGQTWESIHNDPMVAVQHADRLVPSFYPQEFAEPGAFSKMRFTMATDLRELTNEMISLVRRKSGRENVLFLIDEAGQYVAPRAELILNLDGLARNVKELGRGRAWIVATGQQTLTEIVEKAAYNSQELNKLRDRFPISIELDARDIREITWKRLLSKSSAGERTLSELYRRHGQALTTNTRLAGTALFKGELDETTFVRLYPFLPQHFDLLMELVRTLARSTGGIGLRSAIRVIQDVLVDTSKALPPGTPLLADGPLGRLATVDQFYDTLRADIGKVLPHVVTGVERVAGAFPEDDLAVRVAKAVGALQPIEAFPRTAEHIAALLYRQMGDPPNVEGVRETLRRLLDTKELGLVDDPQAGGLSFLSDTLKPIVSDRNSYVPSTPEVSILRSRLLKSLFEALPTVRLEGEKTVRAGVQLGHAPIVGDDEEVQFRLEVAGGNWEERRTELLTETTGGAEWQAAIAWLIRPDEAVDDFLVEALRSRSVLKKYGESETDRDVAQYVRSERRAAESYEERVCTLYRDALQQGTLIFRGRPTPASSAGSKLADAARTVLQEAAGAIYPQYHLVPIRPGTDLAAKFLGVERLDRMSRDQDPLGFVVSVGGKPRIDMNNKALAEAWRVFAEKLRDAGTGRLQGSSIQDLFAAAPYGWTKDATRYVFAALLAAGEIVLHTTSGPAQTSGPAAIEAVRSTVSFNKIGVSLRDSKPSNEALDRAARRLEDILGTMVLPLENDIGGAARERLPQLLAPLVSLPAELRLLGLAGSERAQRLLDTAQALQGQDGAAAIGVLGDPECVFPQDLAWARQVNAAIGNGADRDIERARDAIREAGALMGLFPEVQLVEPDEQDTLQDVLSSEEFYTRLADLRGIAPRVCERALMLYCDRRTLYEADLSQARRKLEALSDWPLLSDDDRTELAGRLALDVPEKPEPEQELPELQRLLVRQAGLAGRLQEAIRDARRRRPSVSKEEPVQPIDFDLGPVIAATVIGDDEQLRVWLESVESAIRNALAAGAPVRLRVDL
jgi:hypothetical protein